MKYLNCNFDRSAFSLFIFILGAVLTTFPASISGQENPHETFANAHSPNVLETAFAPTITVDAGKISDVVVQPSDGKIIIGGSFNQFNGSSSPALIRLNTDGTRDATFNPFNVTSVDRLALQADGKILYVSGNQLKRLNANGTSDASFNFSFTGTINFISDVEALSSGNILVSGDFLDLSDANTATKKIIRLKPGGGNDFAFSSPMMFGKVNSVSVQSNDDIIIAGDFFTVGGHSTDDIARLAPNGMVDVNFTHLVGGTNEFFDAVIQSDGKIITGGIGGNKVVSFPFMKRVNGDGSTDSSFIPFFISAPFGGQINRLALQSDGRVLVGGAFSETNGESRNFVSRINSDGTNDAGFTVGANSSVDAIALQTDGKAVLVGRFTKYGGATVNRIVRTNSDGARDTAFNTGSGATFNTNGFVYATLPLSDGKILVGGFFDKINGVEVGNIARLNADGSVDANFNAGAGTNAFPGFSGAVNTIARDSAGKIYLGGEFTTFDGGEFGRIVRLDANGAIDQTFLIKINGFEGFGVNKIVVQPDDKILVGGDFIRFDGSFQNNLIRLNNDGSEDDSFFIGKGVEGGVVNDLALQSDGKVVLGGSFVAINSVSALSVARLNSDGSRDAEFTGSTDGIVNSIVVQPDGKIVAGGNFLSASGVYNRRIARFNNDGTVDANFANGLGFDGRAVNSVLLLPGDKILVGGDFRMYDGANRNRLVRLNANGTVDDTFKDFVDPRVSGGGREFVDSFVTHLARQTDGKILVAGDFDKVNGIARNNFARLNDAPAAPPNDNFNEAAQISGGSGSLYGTLLNATSETGEPRHNNQIGGHSVWYRWTAPTSGIYSFNTAGSSLDTLLAVYTGSAVSALTEVASNDNAAIFDTTSRVIFPVVNGHTYYIAVDGKAGAADAIKLNWKLYTRTFRFYAQTGNGNVSPRTPTITAFNQITSQTYTASEVSPGTFELDLPADSAVYNVNVGGSDTWSPSQFTIDNSTFAPEEEGAAATGGGTVYTPFVVNSITTAAVVSGNLEGLAAAAAATTTVSLTSEGGPNPILPRPCSVSFNPTAGKVQYSCQTIVDTIHQVKPSLSNMHFAPFSRNFDPPQVTSLSPGDARTTFNIVAGTNMTYTISGTVRSDATTALPEATVQLGGAKMSTAETDGDGRFEFTNLPAGSDYTITVTHPLHTFTVQNITNLQGNQTMSILPGSNCSYTLSTNTTIINGDAGTYRVQVNASNANCPRTATTSAFWITLNNNTEIGSGRLIFTAQPNNNPKTGLAPRQAALTIGNQTLMVMQNAGVTGARVLVGGRIRDANGRGITNARVSITGANGITRTVLTSPFGYFRFNGVESGETYVFSVYSKRHRFAQPTQVRSVVEDVDDIDFTAEN